jgi:hypothetical protein
MDKLNQWAELVGIDPVDIDFLPSWMAGRFNASYVWGIPFSRPFIGFTTPLASVLSTSEGEAVLAHEFGHAVQHAFDPNFSGDERREYEDGADAISGILDPTVVPAIARAFEKIEYYGWRGRPRPENDPHAPKDERVALIKKWADWASNKTEAERREAIIKIAREEIRP